MSPKEQFKQDCKRYGKPSWFLNYGNVVFGWKNVQWSVADINGEFYLYRDVKVKEMLWSSDSWNTDEKAFIIFTEDMSVWCDRLLHA